MNRTVVEPSSGEPGDRLESWKEIATHLNRGVTTVQRWEREENLPVHRHQHDTLGSVYAFKHELESWRAKRAVHQESHEAVDATQQIWLQITNSIFLRHSKLVYIGTIIACLAMGGVAGRISSSRELSKPVRRLLIVPPSSESVRINGFDRNVAITPDGTRIVYVGGPRGSRLFTRSLSELEATPITGASLPKYPFVSPDGKWVGFFDSGATLSKVPIGGGPVTVIAHHNERPSVRLALFPDNQIGATGPRGATWGLDNRIVFGAGEGPLMRVSADGGDPQILASPDPRKGEAAYYWPEYMPDGRALLYTILPVGDWSEKGSRGSIENAQVAVLNLRTGERKVLLEGGSHAHYVESGHLVYAADGALRAVPFDLDKLEITGTPKTVVPQVGVSMRGAADFDVSRDGTLAYLPVGRVENDLATLTWTDRNGREEPLEAPPFVYHYPRISPDGSRVALGSPRDLGMWDFNSHSLYWFGVGAATSYPVWTPDGRRLIFSASREGRVNIQMLVVDGVQSFSRLTEDSHDQFPNAVSPDGNYLLFREHAATVRLMMLSLSGQKPALPLIQTSYREMNGDFSPDGKFVTFQSNESGQDEIYVRPFPNVSDKRWTVSSDGGTRPVWSRNGPELFYLSQTGDMMAVPVQLRGNTFLAGVPKKLFDGSSYYGYYGGDSSTGRTYDVSPDGKRFLMIKPVNPLRPIKSGENIVVILNWTEELKRMVPTH